MLKSCSTPENSYQGKTVYECNVKRPFINLITYSTPLTSYRRETLLNVVSVDRDLAKAPNLSNTVQLIPERNLMNVINMKRPLGTSLL